MSPGLVARRKRFGLLVRGIFAETAWVIVLSAFLCVLWAFVWLVAGRS